MKLYEYNAKEIFKKEGIVISEGAVASSPSEVAQIAKGLETEVCLKSQVLFGGRGKVGGIRFATDPQEAEKVAKELFNLELKGHPVKKLLVVKKQEILKEYYLGITIDFSKKKTALLFSSQGGVEIEELAVKQPGKVIKIEIDPLLGLQNYHLNFLAKEVDYNKDIFSQLKVICQKLYLIFKKYDCLLVEINPLALVEKNELVALDAKLESDDNANYRQPYLVSMWDEKTEDPVELTGKKAGFVTIKLNGPVSIISNGAGNAIYALDLLNRHNTGAANILDLSGGASAEKVQQAVNVVIQDKDVKAILFNVFGGITRCDEIAKGIVRSIKEIPKNISVVCRLQGTNREEGMKILNDAGFEASIYLEDAINKVIKKIV